MEEKCEPDELLFVVHGFVGMRLSFTWQDGVLRVRLPGPVGTSGELDEKIAVPDVDHWRAFLDELGAIGVWQWRRKYLSPEPMCDGTQWELRLRFGDKWVTARGDNAFPPEGGREQSAEFRKLVASFCHLVGVEVTSRGEREETRGREGGETTH